MHKKSGTITLSVALLCSFFLPLFEWHSFEMSGLNYIASSHIPSYKYFLLLIPFAALSLFFGALNGENYLFNRKILVWLPLFTVIFISILRYFNADIKNPFSDDGKVLFGFWLTVCFSLLLVFKNKKQIYKFGKINEPVEQNW